MQKHDILPNAKARHIDSTSADVNPFEVNFTTSGVIVSEPKGIVLMGTRARSRRAKKCYKAKTGKFKMILGSDVGLDVMETLS